MSPPVSHNNTASLRLRALVALALGSGIACGEPSVSLEEGAGPAGTVQAQAMTNGVAGGDLFPCANDDPFVGPKTIYVTPDQNLLEVLKSLGDQDHITLGPGWHKAPVITNFNPTREIKIFAGRDVVLAGLTLRNSSNLSFNGVHFTQRVLLEGARRIKFYNSAFEVDGAGAALEFNGQDKTSGACHDIEVDRCTFKGGGRTIFSNGRWVESAQWNHSMKFTRNDMTCGTDGCVQISAGRDITFAGNIFRGRQAAQAIMLAGGKNVEIVANRFEGPGLGAGIAIKVATPGWEWDKFDGVDFLISENNVIGNNIIHNWSIGVYFAAALHTQVAFNTFANVDISLFMSKHKPTGKPSARRPREPGPVLVERTDGTSAWNNILSSLSVGEDQTRPSYESNNLYTVAGAAGGHSPIEGDPLLDAEFVPLPGSPAIDRGLDGLGAQWHDFELRLRGSKPDLGAREAGAAGSNRNCRTIGAFSPHVAATIRGRIGYDSNRNGRLDPAEPPGSLFLWVDENENRAFDQNTGSFVSTSAPLAVLDYQTVHAEVEVPSVGDVAHVAVKLDLTHTHVGDLEMTLISPSGQRVLLADRVGDGSGGFSGTEFIDTASLNIADGQAPFAGAHRPASALSQLRGARAKGLWRLEVRDLAGADSGFLNQVTLEIRTEERHTWGASDGSYDIPVHAGRVVLRAGQGRMGPWVSYPADGAHIIEAAANGSYSGFDYAIFQ